MAFLCKCVKIHCRLIICLEVIGVCSGQTWARILSIDVFFADLKPRHLCDVTDKFIVYSNLDHQSIVQFVDSVLKIVGLIAVSRVNCWRKTGFASVQLSVRNNSMLRTRTIDNDLNPTWNQRFNLLVDDIDTQSLRKFIPPCLTR